MGRASKNMKIYLVRHGETGWNKEGRLQGRKDISLNQHGIAQMEDIGKWFCDTNVPFDEIIISPLRRAVESAAIIAEIVGFKKEAIVQESLMLERSFGDAEGLLWQERLESGLTDEELGMETVDEVCNRARDCITKIMDHYKGKNILIVAHGAILKAMLVALTNGDIPYESDKVKLAQGMITIVDYKCGSVQVEEKKINQTVK